MASWTRYSRMVWTPFSRLPRSAKAAKSLGPAVRPTAGLSTSCAWSTTRAPTRAGWRRAWPRSSTSQGAGILPGRVHVPCCTHVSLSVGAGILPGRVHGRARGAQERGRDETGTSSGPSSCPTARESTPTPGWLTCRDDSAPRPCRRATAVEPPPVPWYAAGDGRKSLPGRLRAPVVASHSGGRRRARAADSKMQPAPTQSSLMRMLRELGCQCRTVVGRPPSSAREQRRRDLCGDVYPWPDTSLRSKTHGGVVCFVFTAS